MRHSFKMKVGIALGGGAARGLAHVGVLRTLVRNKIPLDVIVGTSMGAIIGGAWVAGGDIDALESQVRSTLSSEQFRKNRLSFLKETKQQRGGLFFSVRNLVRRGVFFGVSNLRPSFVSAEEFAHTMESVVPDVLIDELPKRFGAVALDLEDACEVVICSGSLRKATAASAAIPGVLPPVRRNGRLLIDGGWVDKLPVLPAFKLGADLVIAVDITAAPAEVAEYKRGVDIMVRADSIKDSALVGFQRRMADLVIRPEVQHIHWADFGAHDRCIEAGAVAAAAALPEIRELLRAERLLSLVRTGTGRRMAELQLQAAGDQLAIE